jgi:hypothetical protein
MDDLRPQLLSTSPSIKGISPKTAASVPQASNVAQTQATQTTSRGTNQTHITQLQALSQQLKNTPIINVMVKSTQIIDNKAQQLLVKVNPSLAAQVLIAKNTTINTAIASPKNTMAPLYMVKLAQGANQASLLTTVTPTAFKMGDKLQLQLNSQAQIVIKPSPASVRPAIAEGLKAAQPLQQNISTLLNSLHLLQKLPANIQSLLVTASTAKQLTSITQAIQTPQSLSTPKQVQTALNNSGLFTEQKIQSQQGLSGDLRASLSHLLKALANSNTTSHSFSDTPSSKTFSALENVLTQLLTQVNNAPSSVKLTAESNPQVISTLLQLLGVKSSHQPQADGKKIKDAVAQKLSQMAQGAQDKIQLNQLRSLNGDTSANEMSNTRSSSFTTEIPLRWGDQVLPLQLSIKEYQDKKQSHDETKETGNNKTTRRWQVFLSFDLPTDQPNHIEQLHTQLTVIEKTISATLWTESHSLCQKTKQQLKVLRNNLIANGLDVEDLICIEGKPPKQDLSLDYNLVDIRT